MNQRLLSAFSLKWDPFCQDVPIEALQPTPAIEHFCWRVEHQLQNGGFALITGEPGSGKSVALRLLDHRLGQLPEVAVRVLSRPQSRIPDFYRELGDLFEVPLAPHNRWAGFKALREKWLAHIETTLWRPILLIDEAQEMPPTTLAELRLLSSTHFDSRAILTIVLAGDSRLTDMFRKDDLLPLASRIRVRLRQDSVTPREMLEYLEHSLAAAGNPQLMTRELRTTLAEHAAGNYRVLDSMAGEILALAIQRELPQLDEKLYLELYAPTARPRNARNDR